MIWLPLNLDDPTTGLYVSIPNTAGIAIFYSVAFGSLSKDAIS
jgi:hypothetical protein